MNPTTQQLVQIMGPAFLVIGLAILLNHAFYKDALSDLGKNRWFIIWAAFANMIIGPAILLNHWMWGSLAESVVTIVGILAIVKGLHIALAPENWLKMAGSFSSDSTLKASGILAAIIGILFAYGGYFA